jgi:chromate transporter
MNAAVMIGDRFQGPIGSLLALAGMMAMPLAILVVLAQVYASFSGHPVVQAALAGSAAAAAGLVIGTALKMAARLKPSRMAVLFGVLALAGVALLHWPLWVVLGVLGPLSVAGAAWERRG